MLKSAQYVVINLLEGGPEALVPMKSMGWALEDPLELLLVRGIMWAVEGSLTPASEGYSVSPGRPTGTTASEGYSVRTKCHKET